MGSKGQRGIYCGADFYALTRKPLEPRADGRTPVSFGMEVEHATLNFDVDPVVHVDDEQTMHLVGAQGSDLWMVKTNRTMVDASTCEKAAHSVVQVPLEANQPEWRHMRGHPTDQGIALVLDQKDSSHVVHLSSAGQILDQRSYRRSPTLLVNDLRWTPEQTCFSVVEETAGARYGVVCVEQK